MNVKEVAITIAIAVLFSTLVLVSIDAFYQRPMYNDYCGSNYYPKMLAREPVNCTYITGPEEYECMNNQGMPVYDYDENGCNVFKECNMCNKEYEQANKDYSNNLLLILAPFGIIAIIFGVYFAIEFIGSGFMFSGIFLMLYGTMQNFDQLNRYVRVLIVFIELLLILFIAYKKVLRPKESTEDVKKKRT